MPAEVRELADPWRSLVGTIPHLTHEIEREFRFGHSVIYFAGRYRFGGNIKAGSSCIWEPSTPEAYECYVRWCAQDGIPEREDREAFDRLLAFLQTRGIALVNGRYPPYQQSERRYSPRLGWVYGQVLRVLQLLPDRHLSPPAFRELQLAGWGPDSAKASAYEDGVVMLYDFALEAARRTFYGLMLHELGHAHAAGLTTAPLARLQDAFRVIQKQRVVIGVEYLLDADTRRIYQLRFFEEFLAELHMIYTSQGTRLREFITGLDGPARDAWRTVYQVFVESFDGIEYL